MQNSARVYALGVASIVPAFAMLLLALGGPVILQFFGLWLLAAPAVGALATVAALIHTYRGRPLRWSDVLWVSLLGPFFFVVLPVFWYFKIYDRSRTQPTGGS